jgi:hypothetical protein
MLRLSLEEARGLVLAAQGLLDPPPHAPGPPEVRDTIARLGAVQLDAISVVARTQYLVLWSRLGSYDPAALDAALYPDRSVFEYWSHAASIVPLADYPLYRARMLRHKELMWGGLRAWMEANPDPLRAVLDAIRERGPLASSDFERPDGAKRTGPWDWYGPKDTRRALEALWTVGDLMIHSRRAGQKVYDLRERVLAEAFAGVVPSDDDLPDPAAQLRGYVERTVRTLGLVIPAWVPDYFRIPVADRTGGGRARAVAAVLDDLARAGEVVPATVEGLRSPAFVDPARRVDLERLRAGLAPARTTLLSPFDSLIWDRARARALFGYEVCFEAYVVPAKRRWGYYCLAILHRGRLVGRLDPKFERGARRLLVRAAFLEPGVVLDAVLLDGLAGALRDLARFLGAETVAVERSDPAALAPALAERLAPLPHGGASVPA